MANPLVLLIALIDCSTAVNPLGDSIILTLLIEVPFNVLFIIPSVDLVPVLGFTTTKSGAAV